MTTTVPFAIFEHPKKVWYTLFTLLGIVNGEMSSRFVQFWKARLMSVTPEGIDGIPLKFVQPMKQLAIDFKSEGRAGAFTSEVQFWKALYMLQGKALVVHPSGRLVADRSTYLLGFALRRAAI